MNSLLPVFQSYYSSRPNVVLPQNLCICYSLYLICTHLFSAPLCMASSCLLFLSHFRLPLPWPLALNQLPSLSFISPYFLYLHRPYYHWNIIMFSYLFTCLLPLSPTTHTGMSTPWRKQGFHLSFNHYKLHVSRPEVLKCRCASESLGGLAQTDCCARRSFWFSRSGWAWKFACLTSTQVMVKLLVWGTTLWQPQSRPCLAHRGVTYVLSTWIYTHTRVCHLLCHGSCISPLSFIYTEGRKSPQILCDKRAPSFVS